MGEPELKEDQAGQVKAERDHQEDPFYPRGISPKIGPEGVGEEAVADPFGVSDQRVH